MMHLHDILEMKITDFEGERRRMERLFNAPYLVSSGFVGSRTTSYKDESEEPFIRSCFRGTSIDIDDFFSRCVPYWSNGNLDSLLFYCEVLANIVSNTDRNGVDCRETKRVGSQIFDNIFIVLEKTGYKLDQDEQGIYFVSQKNALATDVIHDLDDKHLAVSILEYNRFSLKGDIDRKRELLNVIGQAIEPILKDKSTPTRCPETYDDVRFALNRLHIRHNNKQGANAQPALRDLSVEDLEMVYDDLYSSMLVLLKVSQLQEGHARMETLKRQMTKAQGRA